MKISVADEFGRIANVQVDQWETIAQFKQRISGQFGTQNGPNVKIMCDGKELDPRLNFAQAKIKNNDMLLIKLGGTGASNPNPIQNSRTPGYQNGNNNQQQTAFGRASMNAMGGGNIFQQAGQTAQRNPGMGTMGFGTNQQNTNFGNQSRNPAYNPQVQQQRIPSARQNRGFSSDPRMGGGVPANAFPQQFVDPAQVEKMKHLERMNKNLEYAHEHMPESFIPATMLYIWMSVNNHKFQAFVDTGAQCSIISAAFARKVGLDKDIDSRFRGVAVGVGTGRIVGRIHSVKLGVGGKTDIQCSLQVLDGIDIPFLLGIDMLKKHRVGKCSNPSVISISSKMC